MNSPHKRRVGGKINECADCVEELETETGLSTGLKQNGSLTVATTSDRLEELKRQVTFAQRFEIEAKEACLPKTYETLDKKIEVLEVDETPAYGLETKLKIGINGVVECK